MIDVAFDRERNWRAIRRSRVVEIDWAKFEGVRLSVTARVRGGNCRLGIWDVENGVLLAESEEIAASQSELTWETVPKEVDILEELKQVRIDIPAGVGLKSYALVVKAADSKGPGAFWVDAAVTFPVISLGGTFTERFTPTENAALAGPVLHAVEAGIDWKEVSDPINAVVADVVLAAWYPVYQSHERARALIRDLNDGSVVHSDWMLVSWGGGIMGSNRPYPGPAKQRFRFALPKKTGIHKYRLEVEVSKTGMAVSAVGTLLFRH